jgi:neutral ceramidase
MSRIWPLAGGVFFFLLSYVPFLIADELRAGIGVAEITPPIPFRMSGYFYERLSTGIKDPLQAKAVVLRQRGEAAALVFCDLIGISLDVSTKARRRAAEATGIPVENIAVAATHSHTGPLYFGALHKHLHDRAVEKFGSDPFEKIDYPTMLVEKIVAAIARANAALEPVQLEAGYAREDRVSFNRRFHMKDGTVRFNPGPLNPDIIRLAGPIDPQVGAIWLRKRGQEKPVAAVVSFALHLDTVSGTEYSADYPAVVEEQLRQSLDPAFTLLFGAGTCGDINHIDVTTRDRRTTTEIGQLLAESLRQARDNHEFAALVQPSLAVSSVKVRTPLQEYSESEIAAAREKMAVIGTRQLPFLEEVEACKIMDLELRDTDEFEIQAFRLSPEAVVVTLAGEVFVELGLAIKAASPFKTTLVIELANDDAAYIPTKKAFAEGSYETVNSHIRPGGGELLVDAAIKLLNELK